MMQSHNNAAKKNNNKHTNNKKPDYILPHSYWCPYLLNTEAKTYTPTTKSLTIFSLIPTDARILLTQKRKLTHQQQ